jgi:hypothetical protein
MCYHDNDNLSGTVYNTMLMFEGFKRTGIPQSNHISEADRLYLQQQILSCNIHHVIPCHSETALLWRRGVNTP